MLYFVAAGPAVAAGPEAGQAGRTGRRPCGDRYPATPWAAHYQPAGLTAVLVYRDGLVRSINPQLGSRFQLKDGLKALHGQSPQGLDDPDGNMLLAGQAGLRAA